MIMHSLSREEAASTIYQFWLWGKKEASVKHIFLYTTQTLGYRLYTHGATDSLLDKSNWRNPLFQMNL